MRALNYALYYSQWRSESADAKISITHYGLDRLDKQEQQRLRTLWKLPGASKMDFTFFLDASS